MQCRLKFPHFLEFVGSRQSPVPCLVLQAPSLHRHYPASSVQRTSRHPGRPGLIHTDLQLMGTSHHRWGFPCCVGLLMLACCPHYPGGTTGCSCRSPSPVMAAFPVSEPGRHPHYTLSTPAQRSLGGTE